MGESLEFNKKNYFRTPLGFAGSSISVKILELNGVLDKAISNSVISEKEIFKGNDYIYPEILNLNLENYTTKNIDFIKKQIGKCEILFIVSEIEIGKTDKILDILKNLEQDTNQVNIFIAIDSKNIETIDQLIEENFENLTSYMRVENVEIALQGIEGIISFFSPYLMLGEDFRNVIDFLFGRKITPLQ
ncbi:MAG: hypothetical protein ACRC6E_05765, partial [Fusobacteriaceae bacterium]